MTTTGLFLTEDRIRSRSASADPGVDPWRVLVVDDEAEVHTVTKLALGRIRFRGRGIQVYGALSAREAADVLRAVPDVAIVLLDVVMETDAAGLDLVRTIREEMNNHAVRIILRTGQPGQAPEEGVVLDYDINDYKAKTELTTRKLFTAVVSALRAYSGIVALEASRRGLQRIIESTDRLFELRSMRPFAAGVLTQLAAFLGTEAEGILCVRNERPCRASGGVGTRVLAGAGRFAAIGEGPFDALVRAPEAVEAVAAALQGRATVFGAGHTTLYIATPEGHEVVAWMRTDRPLDEMDRALLGAFAAKIAASFANVCLYERLREANEQLEARVAERTRALEEANAKLEHLATVDVLTSAWNRRHFMERAAAEVARAWRHGRPLSVLLFDLDHFKLINDTYGHAAGDEALRTVVARTRDALRTSDHIGRFGGEEFAVLLPETDGAAAAVVAERVRNAIAATPIAFDQHRLPVTASIGVATWQDSEASIEHALRRADAALYDAKLAGRDRVSLGR